MLLPHLDHLLKRRHTVVGILRVGTSASGARAKAVIAWNRETNEMRTGQAPAGEGFKYWLLKFDGVKGPRGHGPLVQLGDGALLPVIDAE